MQTSDVVLHATSPRVEAGSPSTRCRYKTGRCPNTRAVKANGTLLLLCEYHRNQQNRTKKRSDMKCRHDRAKKRQAQREKTHKKQQRQVAAVTWSPLASIVAPQIDESAGNMSIFASPSVGEDQEKSHESTSPTAVDFDVSAVNWAPQCMSPIMTPMRLQERSLEPEDIWLLEYFIL
ncbi:hypothetical protein PF005_g26740 [Phytophthora fragariae]|uniref:Uncharacterized protein n=2 Tax=Phytophthora TaxID=4783 RepID=A0A6A3DQB4_9STRA|nr:hypothetical protein PF003_g7572 [Phytophthora fragariae]KAE9025348.1 hypothetical protein PR002_g11221 [Phytophthora rubi]KAE8922286.1 hypothetical protein PF009_g27449 [Phytophthora fragariae]KAE8972694.1 hypothetical protein PF011_g25545 [Phytophthora fragariae]KAE9026011.1 hypothetical protein PR001_g12291 [Phytophthora rubi]